MNILILSRSQSLYSTNRILEVGLERGHDIRVVDYMRCYMNIESENPLVYYGGESLDNSSVIIPRIGASVTSYGTAVVRQFELMGCYCVNTSDAILNSRDKLKALQILSNRGISLPDTGFASHTKDIEGVIEKVGSVPLVMKLLQGTQGHGVVLAETRKAALAVMSAFRQLDADIMVQEFIKESAGTDIRALVVGDEVVASMRRIAPRGEFRSNLHQGGEMVPIKLTGRERRIAVDAARILKLSIAGVDFMRSERGPLVLEVNSSPGLQGIEACSGVDVAKKIFQFIEKRMNDYD